MLCPSLGVRTAQVFAVSSVLGSTEGERWQAGPRFSPRHDLPHVRFQKSRGAPSRIEGKGFWHNVTEMRPQRRMALILVGFCESYDFKAAKSLVRLSLASPKSIMHFGL